METVGTGREEGQSEKDRKKGMEGIRIASIDYEARWVSLMADSGIYRVNGRQVSIPTWRPALPAINIRLYSLDLFASIARRFFASVAKHFQKHVAAINLRQSPFALARFLLRYVNDAKYHELVKQTREKKIRLAIENTSREKLSRFVTQQGDF